MGIVLSGCRVGRLGKGIEIKLKSGWKIKRPLGAYRMCIYIYIYAHITYIYINKEKRYAYLYVSRVCLLVVKYQRRTTSGEGGFNLKDFWRERYWATFSTLAA